MYARELESVREALAARADEELTFLRELIQTVSVTGEERAVQELIRARCTAAGLEVEVQEFDFSQVASYLRDTADKEFRGRPNIIVRLPGNGNGRSLLLNGHCDTVAPGDESRWRYPPFAGLADDGFVWGCGSSDMKAGLCACLYTLIAIRDAGIPLAGDLLFASTVAEESGGAGTIAYVLDHKSSDAAIVAEPTRLAVAPAHTGSAQLRITLRGLSAHACVRDVGVSAIEKFVGLFDELRAYETERNKSAHDELYQDIENKVPVNVGLVRGGISPSMVPEEVVIGARMGFMPAENFDEVRLGFEERIAGWARQDPWLAEHMPVVEWSGSQFPPSSIPTESKFVQSVVQSFTSTLGRMPVVTGMTYGSDMSHLIRLGRTPTLLFGPGDIARAHRTDEYVAVDEVLAATRVLVSAAVDWCGTSSNG